MKITQEDVLCVKRLQALEKQMNPSWYHRERIARPVLDAFKVLSVVFATAAIGLAVTFGVSMVIPAAGLLISAVALGILSIVLRRDYSKVDPDAIIKKEKIALDPAFKGNINARMKLLEDSDCPLTTSDLIPLLYGKEIEDFDFETLALFCVKENLPEYMVDIWYRLKKALIKCDAGFIKKSTLCKLFKLSEKELMSLIEDRELSKSYPEYILRNGPLASTLLSKPAQLKLTKLSDDYFGNN